MMHYPVMPWGKYRGQLLVQIPGSYLFWLLESCDLDQRLDFDIRNELQRRLGSPQPEPARQGIEPSVLVAWCRRAALFCHPDRGGSVESMKLVNELRQMADLRI